MTKLCPDSLNPRIRQSIAAVATVFALLLCSGQAQAAQATHQYRVAVDAELETLTVEARFDGLVHSVAARSRRAGRYLQEFSNCDETPHIRMRNRRLIVPAEGIRCMTYSVDLRAVAANQRQNNALSDDNLVASSSSWLWRPEVTANAELQIEFDLPDGVSVAVPWQALDNSGKRFRITRSPESANAPIAFGRFQYEEITIPGATLRVSLMNGEQPMDNDEILRWVEAAATDVVLAYGRFPNPSPQVLVIPVADEDRHSASAVPFGRVIRDGGESVELFINQTRPLTAFLDDWTATHEFSHLMLPYVSREHRWISEGFAQYYQNVLLARAGAYDPQRAWQKLYEGFERGRRSRPELSPNDAAEGGARAGTMKVYWSGAAIALMADVRLREESNGEQTLDDVLQSLQSCCLPSDRVWSGPELFATLDQLAGKNVFMPLYNRYANTIGFPDTSPTFAALGMKIDDGRVRIQSESQLPGMRAAITAVNPQIARWREQLAARSGSQRR